jgi:hypothetical protein
MLTLGAAATIQGVAGTTSVITCTIFGMTLTAGVETYGVLSQGSLSNSVGVLYTVPGSNTAFVKKVMLANTTASSVSGIILYVNGTASGNRITGSFSIPANGTATLDDNGLAVYDANGSQLSAVLSQSATALSAASALPAGTTAVTQSALDASTKVATTAYTDAAIAAFGLTYSTVFQVNVNLGTRPKKSGKFTITSSGLTPGDPVIVTQAASRPGSALYDSVEMDQIIASGFVLNSTTISVNWGCRTYVSNQYTFNYWLGN